MSLPLFSQALSRSTRWLACLVLALPLAAPAQTSLAQLTNAAVTQSEQVRAELIVHAPDGVAPGKTAWLGLQLAHAPEWHTYWKNSGDSGQPTELQWTLPPGVSAGPVNWPTPRKFPIGPLANYGYNGSVVLPVPLTVDASFKGTEIEVKLYAAWLACRKECIPEEAHLSLRLPVASALADHKIAFEEALTAAPKDMAAGNSTVVPSEKQLQVQLAALPAAWRGKTLEFFPETLGLIEPGSPWTQSWNGEAWTASVPLSPYRSESPASLPVVVALANAPGEGAGSTGVRLVLPVSGGWAPIAEATALPEALNAALASSAPANTALAPSAPAGPPITLWAALLGALLGGMILNLMPCVFPVLAIKVLAFAQHADDRAAHRTNGLAYTGGVVLSFLLLGGLLLGLRAAGEQLGWGFQLQSPTVVATLAVLFTLIGLNLGGLFEFGSVLPSSVATLQAKNPTADAFLTGVLATAIASPCTAPFMGASLGLAIGLPTAQALAVFGALGLGMALPYLAASWWPAIARALPRPGAWMNTFRQLMAFPMFATVVWLLWVLGQQTGIDGAAALLMCLVVMALFVWSLGLPSGKGRTALTVLSLAGLLWIGWVAAPRVTQLQAPDAAGGPVATSLAGLQWQAWSPERQAELLASGQPVFVDFTAAWCVTCQYNKRTTLADAEVLADFAARKVALLRADWTRRDPAVTAALAALGRNGVPVYALHQAGQAPHVLSEVLSVSDVRQALARLTP